MGYTTFLILILILFYWAVLKYHFCVTRNRQSVKP